MCFLLFSDTPLLISMFSSLLQLLQCEECLRFSICTCFNGDSFCLDLLAMAVCSWSYQFRFMSPFRFFQNWWKDFFFPLFQIAFNMRECSYNLHRCSWWLSWRWLWVFKKYPSVPSSSRARMAWEDLFSLMYIGFSSSTKTILYWTSSWT